MEHVDFGFSGVTGLTIYRRSFQMYLEARLRFKRPETDCSNLLEQTEKVFWYLIEQGNRNGYNVDAILEIPPLTGETCFHVASHCSEKICSYIIERGIKVNTINTLMRVPQFTYPNLAIKMMQKGINPHVIDYDGVSPIEKYADSFQNEDAKKILSESPRSINLRSIHYSIEDIDCAKTCRVDCPSKFKKFYCKNGSLLEMTDENRIGSGGFSMVFRQLFHGIQMAMKCVWIGDIENQRLLKDGISDLENNISEIKIQIATAGTGVIVPVAVVRQQNQEQDENQEWIATNYNVFIYPLYDCNLYELHENHYEQFSQEIIIDIFAQCLTRKSSNRRRSIEILVMTCLIFFKS